MPVVAKASLDLAQISCSTYVATSENLTLLLKHRSGTIWESLIPGGGLSATDFGKESAQEELVNLLSEAAEATGASAIYFPLIYESCRAYSWLNNFSSIICWNRPGSSSVKVRSFNDSEDVFSAAGIHNNKINKWKKRLTCSQLQGPRALEILRQVDTNSWKKSLGCSIFDGEEEFFDTALRTDTYTAWAAWDASTPIAYRIDTGIGDTLYTMEWSYDQRFRTLSPGAFIALSSINYARIHGYEQVDFYGSPDSLKSSIETHQRSRFDFLWIRDSWTTEHEELRSERVQHDQGLDNARKRGVGLARYYGQPQEYQKDTNNC